jgi:hypothetical protein
MRVISASVGVGGVNNKSDVLTVQQLLKKAGKDPGKSDGVFGPRTKAAIIGYQSGFLIHPDGRIDPEGRTIRKLTAVKSGGGAAPVPPRSPSIPQPDSATHESWTGDSSQWPQDKKLRSMAPSFRAKVEQVVAALKQRGLQPKIFYGWRSVAVQQKLFAAGKSTVKFSFHNGQTPGGVPYAWAADIVDARWGWKEPDCMVFFKALGEEARKVGLVWGGDWEKFRDWAHIQGRQNSELSQVKRESGL